MSDNGHRRRRPFDAVERACFLVKSVFEEVYNVKDPIVVIERVGFRKYEAYVDSEAIDLNNPANIGRGETANLSLLQLLAILNRRNSAAGKLGSQ